MNLLEGGEEGGKGQDHKFSLSLSSAAPNGLLRTDLFSLLFFQPRMPEDLSFIPDQPNTVIGLAAHRKWWKWGPLK